MAKNEIIPIEEIDYQINKYVTEDVLPLLLPYDATDKEVERLKRVLTPVVALDIYNKELKEMYDACNVGKTKQAPSSDIVDELKKSLVNSSPKTNSTFVQLKGPNCSRYAQGYWGYNNWKSEDVRKMQFRKDIERYAKSEQGQMTPRQIRELKKEYPHILRAADARYIFHNGGNARRISKEDKFFKSAEDTVKEFRRVLKSKKDKQMRKEVGDTKISFTEEELSKLQREYNKACRRFNTSFSISKFLLDLSYTEQMRDLVKEQKQEALAQEREQERIEKEKQLEQEAMRAFDELFPQKMVMNEAGRKRALRRMCVDVYSQMYANDENGREKWEKSGIGTKLVEHYEELMQQYEDGTLPKELSFDPKIREEIKNKDDEQLNSDLKKMLGVGAGLAALLLLGSIAEAHAEELTPQDVNSAQIPQKAEDIATSAEEQSIQDNFDGKKEIVVLTNILLRNGFEEDLVNKCKEIEEDKKEILEMYGAGQKEFAEKKSERRHRKQWLEMQEKKSKDPKDEMSER